MSRFSVDPPPAMYHSSEIPEFRGNPLIEALPPVPDERMIAKHLMNLPAFAAQERSEPPHIRRYFAERLYDAFVPLPFHIEFADTIGRVIRTGYKARHPFDPYFVRHRHFLACHGQDGVSAPPFYRTSSSAMCLTGLSGIGKSSLLKAVLSQFPQIVRHECYQDKVFTQTQVVWLKIDCPPDGSLKGLCFSFLSALDKALGTDLYFKQHGKQHTSADKLLEIVQRLALTHHIGLLVIDELQHLRSAKSGNAQQMLNFLVNLVNNIGVPLIVAGTYSMIDLYKSALRDARRASGQGIMSLDRLSVDDPRWRFLVDTLWRYQWTTDVMPLTEETSYLLHDLTQGVTDVLIKLLVLAQQQAIRQNNKCVDAAILKHMMETKLVLLQPALNALRGAGAGKKEQFTFYEDLMPAAEQVLQHMAAAEPKISLETLAADIAEMERNREKEAGISDSHHPNDETSATKSQVLDIASLSEIESIRINEIDLRTVAESDEPYQGLVDLGVVLSDPLMLNRAQ